jgi:hypothetical protein
VQPSSAQVRVSPKARTIGPAPTARRLPLRISTTMLGLFPHPRRANSSRPRHTPRRSGSLWPRRVGCRLLGSPPMWCWSIRMGWAGWAWHEGLSPTGPTHGRRPDRAGTRPASPDRRAGRGVHRARELARGTAVDPGLGGRLDAGELFAWVDGSSVSLTCSYADQGGCHVDMVVGADHRGRSRVAVWRDAGPPSPLTAPPVSPITAGAPSRPGRRPGGVAGASRPSGRSRPPALPGRRARVPAPVLPALLALQHAGDSP